MMTVSDLSPDALARLEAKLVADLEMVRRVRALLVEHQALLGNLAAPVALPREAGTVIASAEPPKPEEPKKSYDELVMEALMAMPENGFQLPDFRSKVGKLTKNYPKGPYLKKFLNQLMRKGQIVVLETCKGRNGYRYKCTIPRPEPIESEPEVVDSPDVLSITQDG